MKISIITVSFNSAETIADTVKSVATQTYKNVEHLVVDGQSKDDTVSVVEANRHDGLRIISEPDGGIYDAMNKGLRLSSGDVIGFLNSDDFFADKYAVEMIAAVFSDPVVEASYADLVYVTPDKKRVDRYWKSKPFKRGEFAKGWAPAHPTFYVRRTALERLGLFDLSFKLAADTEFMIRYLERGKIKSVYIPHILVKMRLGGATNQSWANIVKQNKEIFLAFQKNGLSYAPSFFWVNKLLSRACQYFYARVKRIE